MRVYCRPWWWSRQWCLAEVVAEAPKKYLVMYGVDTDWFGSYEKLSWCPKRRCVQA